MTNAIHSLSSHLAVLDTVMRWAASYLVFGVLALFLLAWWYNPRGVRACVVAATAAVVALGLSSLIGNVWDRPRPFVAEHFVPLIVHGADASFPSDHVAALAAVATAMWHASRRIGVVAWVLAVVVGFARVYVGVHWVTDVVGGAVLGSACALFAWWLSGRFPGVVNRFDDLAVALHARPARYSRGNPQ